MRNLAIINTHSNVASVSRENGILQGFDKDYNIVTLDENKVSIEESRLQAEYDAQEYARNRQAEYPTIAELTVALYDTDDKSAVEAKRAAVKLKYPKS